MTERYKRCFTGHQPVPSLHHGPAAHQSKSPSLSWPTHSHPLTLFRRHEPSPSHAALKLLPHARTRANLHLDLFEQTT